MKNIILTSGPRGAGKTTFSKQWIEEYPNTDYLSRDKLLIDLFGETSLNPYTTSPSQIHKLFMKQVEQKVQNKSNSNIIIDYWNGFPEERRFLIDEFRKYDIDKVICWKFITPKNVCLDWFMKKEDVEGYFLEGIARDYDLYHEMSKNIHQENFDAVYLINPLQLQLRFNK